MRTVLEHIAQKKKFQLPDETAKKIIEDSDGNLRKAILVFEALRMQSYVLHPSTHSLTHSPTHSYFCSPDFSGSLTIAKPDWETYCHKVADLIVQEQSPARVMEVRAKFYELLSHCIPPTVILKTVADRVVERVDEAMKADIMHWAAIYVSSFSLLALDCIDDDVFKRRYG